MPFLLLFVFQQAAVSFRRIIELLELEEIDTEAVTKKEFSRDRGEFFLECIRVKLCDIYLLTQILNINIYQTRYNCRQYRRGLLYLEFRRYQG